MFKSLSVEVFAQWYASYTKLTRMCVGMTVERQICSENLHCATILFLTLPEVSIGGNEKQLWRSSFVAFFPPE